MTDLLTPSEGAANGTLARLAEAQGAGATIERLIALEKAATPGPWPQYGIYTVLRHFRKTGCDADDIGEENWWSYDDTKDSDFIAALRNAAPALIAVARAAKEYKVRADAFGRSGESASGDYEAWKCLTDALAALEEWK